MAQLQLTILTNTSLQTFVQTCSCVSALQSSFPLDIVLCPRVVRLRSVPNVSFQSQTAAFALSSSKRSRSLSSFSRFLRLISCSFVARSYCRCSSVFLGALTPKPAAIMRLAAAVVFSGLLSTSERGVLLPDDERG